MVCEYRVARRDRPDRSADTRSAAATDIVLALFGTLWYLAVVNYFPAHLRLVSQRMSFYLFGDASPSDAIPSKFST